MNPTTNQTESNMTDHVLQVGDKLQWSGQLCRCSRVGESSADIVPDTVRPVTITNPLTGKSRTFTPSARAIQVSCVVGKSLIVA